MHVEPKVLRIRPLFQEASKIHCLFYYTDGDGVVVASSSLRSCCKSATELQLQDKVQIISHTKKNDVQYIFLQRYVHR